MALEMENIMIKKFNLFYKFYMIFKSCQGNITKHFIILRRGWDKTVKINQGYHETFALGMFKIS
jgi:hypothetical protein